MTEEKKDPTKDWKDILSGKSQLSEETLKTMMKDLTDKFSASSLFSNNIHYTGYWDTYRWPYRYPHTWHNTCMSCGKRIGVFWSDRCLCPWNQDQEYKWYSNPTYWGTTTTTHTPAAPEPVEEDDEENEEKPVPTGWLCPICQNVYAPSVLKCPEC